MNRKSERVMVIFFLILIFIVNLPCSVHSPGGEHEMKKWRIQIGWKPCSVPVPIRAHLIDAGKCQE